MRFSRTTWITIAVVLGALAFAAAFGSRGAPEVAPSTARAQVKVVALERTRLGGEVRAGGFLRAREDVTISAERAGRVVALPVAEGAAVAAGAVVACLDDEVAAANLERARAVVREAVLQPNLPAAELARAREQLRVAEHELELRNPVAPIAGTVEVHHVDVGEYVMPGTPLVDVIDATSVVLDVDVDPEIVESLRTGQEVPVVVTPLNGAAPRNGRVTRVASRADARTRRFRVEVELKAAGTRAVPKPGMHAEARFRLPAGEPAFHLPKAATRRTRGQLGVYVVVDGTARWRPVRCADIAWRPDLCRVTEGELEEGGMLVVQGFAGLRDGMPVEVRR